MTTLVSTSNEACIMKIFCETLNLTIFLYVAITSVEVINDVCDILFKSLPNFDAIITIVVARKQTDLTFGNASFDVGVVNTVRIVCSSHQLNSSLTSDAKKAIQESIVIYQGGLGAMIDSNGVAKKWTKEFVDWMSIRKVSHRSHGIGLHSSMATQEMSANLVKLKIQGLIS